MEYCNPVYDGYFADPFVWRHEGTYYAVGTDPRPPLPGENVFPLLRSENFVQWERVGSALIRPDLSLGTDFWAPEVAFSEGKFYLYYSVGFADKDHRLRVAVSDSPAGPYVDADVDLVDPDKCSFAIDAHPFRDGDGAWYLFYARDFLEHTPDNRVGTALVVDRLSSMTRLGREERVVLRATQDWQRFMKDRPMYGNIYDWHTLEGPFVWAHQGRYYCFYSGGRWEDETYGVDYAEADHPMGPWMGGSSPNSPRVLRTIPRKVRGPGHNSVAVATTGTEYLVYHAWGADMKARKMCIDPLIWTEEGPRCKGPSWVPQRLE